MTRKHALVVGINEYDSPNLHPLRGCVNDARRMAELLSRRFGFRVRRLIGRAATRAAVIDAMTEILESCETDAEIVFFWSGHGSCLKSTTHGTFETLVPVDSGRPGNHDPSSPNRDLTDREIFAWILKLSRFTHRVTLIFDACRSGGLVRDLDPVPRGVQPELRRGALEDKTAFLDLAAAGSRGVESGPSPGVALADRYVLVGACRAGEICRETRDEITGRRHGLLTLHLCEALQRASGEISWQELADTIAPRIKKTYDGQNLHLEGAVHRQVFGSSTLRPEPYATVTGTDFDDDGPIILLDRGAIHGAVRSSIWSLAPSDARRAAPDESAGRIRIELVDAVTSQARPEGQDAALPQPGQRAFEVERPGDTRLRVLVDPRLPQPESYLSSPLLTEVGEPEDADLILRWVEPRRKVSAGDLLPAVQELIEPWLAITDPGRTPKAPPRPVGALPSEHSRTAQSVARDLERLARRRFIEHLEHPHPTVSLSSRVDVELCRRSDAGGTWTPVPEGGHVALGDHVALRLRRREAYMQDSASRAFSKLYVAVLDLGLSGAITAVYPRRGHRDPWTRQELKIGFRSDDAMRLSLPAGYPFPGEGPFAGTEESLVILLTTRYTDFDLLTQEGTGVVRSSGDPIQAILERTFKGPTLRSGGKLNLLADPETWGLIRCRFRVVP